MREYNYAVSMNSKKQEESRTEAQMIEEVIAKYNKGDTFYLEPDPRMGISNGGRSTYKPGNYEIIGFYPHYILAERSAETLSGNICKFKESFTYSDMYQIMNDTFPGLYSGKKEEEDE